MFKEVKLCFRLVFLCWWALAATGCASITGSPMHNVRIDSEPKNAAYTITDETGEQIAAGTTPDSVTLRTSAGIFQRSRYFVTFESDGFDSQTNKLNAQFSPWYVANILFSVPGILGLLIIDPFTGAMFRLPDVANAVLSDNGKEATQ